LEAEIQPTRERRWPARHAIDKRARVEHGLAALADASPNDETTLSPS
jgi:hypothetical protein